MFRLSIRRKLVLAFALVLLPLILLQVLMLDRWLQERKDSLLDGQRKSALSAVLAIESYIDNLSEDEAMLGKTIVESATGPQDIDIILRDFVLRHKEIAATTFAKPDGTLVASYPDPAYRTLKWPSARGLTPTRLTGIGDTSRAPLGDTPEWTLARAIETPDGQITGVIEAHLRESVFADLVTTESNTGLELAILDSSGRLVYTNSDHKYSIEESDWSSDKNILNSLSGKSVVTGNFDKAFSYPGDLRPRMGVALPIPSMGWVVATAVREEDALRATQEISYVQFGALFMVALLSIAGGIIAGSILARPLKNLRRQALTIAAGDLSGRVDIRTGDEIEDLAHAFNLMADSLQEHELENHRLILQLQRAESQRRELISLVTHDLKGPLSIIKGYAGLIGREPANGSPNPLRQKATTMIDLQTNTMIAMLDQLSAISKADINQPLRLQNADLVEIAAQAIESFQVTTGNHVLSLKNP